MFRVDIDGGAYDYCCSPSLKMGGGPVQVVLCLDGATPSTEGNMAKLTRLNSLVENRSRNTVVVYPYANRKRILQVGRYRFGTCYSWNMKDTGLSPYDPELRDDEAFLDGVIADLRTRFTFRDLSGAGFSEGGMVLQQYAINRPGLLYRIASVHGTCHGHEFDRIGADRSKLPEVLIVHSGRDRVLPWRGGRGLFTLLMPGAKASKPKLQAERWAAVHGATPEMPEVNDTFIRTEYRTAAGRPVVIQYFVPKGAHAWDGSEMGSWIFGRPLPRHKFDVSQIVWKFLTNSP